MRGNYSWLNFTHHYFTLLTCIGRLESAVEATHWKGNLSEIQRVLQANSGNLINEAWEIEWSNGSLVSKFGYDGEVVATQNIEEFFATYKEVISLKGLLDRSIRCLDLSYLHSIVDHKLSFCVAASADAPYRMPDYDFPFDALLNGESNNGELDSSSFLSKHRLYGDFSKVCIVSESEIFRFQRIRSQCQEKHIPLVFRKGLNDGLRADLQLFWNERLKFPSDGELIPEFSN